MKAGLSSKTGKRGRARGSAHFIEDDVSQLLSPRGIVRGGRQQQDLQAGRDCHQDPGLQRTDVEVPGEDARDIGAKILWRPLAEEFPRVLRPRIVLDRKEYLITTSHAFDAFFS
jgi:hypothetical protein